MHQISIDGRIKAERCVMALDSRILAEVNTTSQSRDDMKAVWYDQKGPAREVFNYGDMPMPEAGAGEVRIKLEASGVNPSDTYRRAGTVGPMEYPRVIANSDGAGIVDQLGPGAKRFKLGDRVWLYNGQRNGRAFGTAAVGLLAEPSSTLLPISARVLVRPAIKIRSTIRPSSA
jgi:hypothetical protein